MSPLLLLLEELIPVGSVVLSAVSALAGFLAWKKVNVRLADLKEKIELSRESPIVEDHEELPGFQQQVDADDVE